MDVYKNQSRLTDIVVTKGDKEGEMDKLGVWGLEIQTLYIKQVSNKDILCSIGSYSHYFIAILMKGNL